MIQFTQGSLLEAGAEALASAVNAVGVVGRGIALALRGRFPEGRRQCESACGEKQAQAGKMFVAGVKGPADPRRIVNSPAKMHWRNNSGIEWIREGLRDLRERTQGLKIRSIAIPAPGAGSGGLDWRGAKPVIEGAQATCQLLGY